MKQLWPNSWSIRDVSHDVTWSTASDNVMTLTYDIADADRVIDYVINYANLSVSLDTTVSKDVKRSKVQWRLDGRGNIVGASGERKQ